MRKGFARVGFIFGVVGLTATSMDAAPVFSLKAVKKNNVAITPTNDLTIAPLDTIEAEIRISGWGDVIPGGARSYSAMITGRSGADSGGNGTVLPFGWNAPLDPTPCPTGTECCPDEVCMLGRCVWPGHNPTAGASINPARADFVFAGMTTTRDVQIMRLDYTYFALAWDDTALDMGTEYYGGTLKLVASDYACGTFTYGFFQTLDTFIADANNIPQYPTVVPLTLRAPTCPPIPQYTVPPNCAVDAGLPHAVNNAATKYGYNYMKFEFDAPAAGMTCSDFLITVVPFATAPRCKNVLTSGSTAIVNLDPAAAVPLYPLQKWTCFRHRPSNILSCVGYLPGDSDVSLLTQPADVQAMVSDLRAPPIEMDLTQCDIDRSNKCAPQDILTAIDLLNGAEALTSWNGKTITETCPSAEGCP